MTYSDDVVARQTYDSDLAQYILHDIQQPDLIVCAGWMHILTPAFLAPIKSVGIPIINLHPALPRAFNGAHAIQRAWEAFKDGKITKTGVMIHSVIEEVDEGEPILVREITMEHGESLEDLDSKHYQPATLYLIGFRRLSGKWVTSQGDDTYQISSIWRINSLSTPYQ